MKHKSVYLMLAVIISTMGTFIVINALSNFTGFMVYLGFTPEGSGTLISWILAFIVTVLYCYSAAKNSDVKRYMFKLDILKCISIVAAVCAGIVEEVVFRKWVMDYLDSEGFSIFIQIFASGVAFSVVHVIWGIKNIKAGVNAAISTFLLGLALGAIYFLGDRSLAPCIMAHFVICMLIEPGLLISASRDRLGHWSEKEENS